MSVPAPTSLWILRSPLPGLIRDYCRLHQEVNLPLRLEVRDTHDLRLVDQEPTLLCTSLEADPARLLPLIVVAQEQGRAVHVRVLLPSPETLARTFHVPIQEAQRNLGKFRRPLPLLPTTFQIESSASGFWLPEPDVYSKLSTFAAHLADVGQQFPHLGGLFDDLTEELRQCLID